MPGRSVMATLLALASCGANDTEQDGGHAQNGGKPWSFGWVDGARRFEVRSGDRWKTDGDAPKERSETYFSQKMHTGKTYRVAFRFLVEQGPRNTASWLVLSQIQSTFVPGDRGHSPPVALEMKGERLRVMSRTSPLARPGQDDVVPTMHFSDTVDLVRGKWHPVEMVIRFDPAGAGVLKVRYDGQEIVDYAGPLGFNEPIGAYVKQGIYRGHAPEPLAVRFTEPAVSEITAP
jgi:hypothetical protein